MIAINDGSQPGEVRLLRLVPLNDEAIAPFGAIISAPVEIGDRSVYTQWLGGDRSGMTPRLHVNRVGMSTLPIVIDMLEQHPYSQQIFLPFDVARYVIVVAPANPEGEPDLALAQAFLAPGNLGILYRRGVWHAGATVLDRSGSFGVLMWRNDSTDDEKFFRWDSSLYVEL